MKKTICLALAFLVLLCALLSGCRTKDDPAQTQEADGGTSGTDASVGQADREVLPDHRNITPSGEHSVRMLFLNVGKGDAILFSVDGDGWLIDTGTAATLPMLAAGMKLLGLDALRGVRDGALQGAGWW